MPQLPSSVDAEQTLLGSFIVYPDKIFDGYEENLTPEDFYLDKHSKIYRVILELSDERIPVDVTSVITRLNDKHLLNSVGGADYIVELTELAFSEENVGHYIRTIQEKATLRKLIAVSEEISRDSYDNSYDVTAVLGEAERKILNITRNVKTTDFVSSEKAMAEALARIRELQNRKGLNGVPSGYMALDNITNGFQPGDLIILAARPSVGKTAFALNIALNASTGYDKAVAIFSLEMPVLQLSMRMLSAKGQVDANSVRTGKNLSDNDFGSLNKAAEAISKAKLYMDDSPSIKINEIFAKCRKLKADDALDMVIIDYLQLIMPSSTRGADNRQQEVSEISRSLKALARELNVPVIALSQLSRLVEQRRGDNKPMLSDLRESGSIEQDADVVLFLYRPGKTASNNEEKAEEAPQEEMPNDIVIEENVIIGKHRNGSIGEITLMFQPGYNCFYNKEFGND